MGKFCTIAEKHRIIILITKGDSHGKEMKNYELRTRS